MSMKPVIEKRQDTTKTKSVPVSQDLIYQAKQMFPGYDDNMAMALYVMDKAERQQETDNQQNKLIQTQKAQNDKLTGQVRSIGQELQDFERQSMETDQEVERLKQLAAKLRPAGELQQQQAKVSADELAKLDQKLEQLKSVPGMDQQKFNELSKRVEQISTSEATDNEEIQKIEKVLSTLQGRNGASDEMFNKTMDALEHTQRELIGKEKRFRGYVKRKREEINTSQQRSAEELKQYSDTIKKIQGEVEQTKSTIANDLKDINAMKQDIGDIVKYKEEIGKITNLAKVANEFDIIQNLRGAIQQDAETISDIVTWAKGIRGQAPDQTRDGEVDPNLAAQDVTARAQAAARNYRPGLPTNKAPGRDLREPVKSNEPPFVSESKLYEEIQLTRQYAVPEYAEWLLGILPLLVKNFRDKYRIELRSPDHQYGDKQIARVCEEHAHWIMDNTTPSRPVLTPKQLSAFLTIIKIDLFQQPVEPEQQDLPLKEGIGNIFENMVNQIYKNL